MATIWCPYLGANIDEAESNPEHIIPGILGGTNTFTIRVHRGKNHDLGTRLDQSMARVPLITTAIAHYDLQGHHRKTATVHWPAEVRGYAGKVIFTKDHVRFDSFRSFNEYGLNISQPLGSEHYESHLQFDRNLLLSFAAKVALGTGWYFFGDVFRDYGYHNELRSLMDSDEAVKVQRGLHAALAEEEQSFGRSIGPSRWLLLEWLGGMRWHVSRIDTSFGLCTRFAKSSCVFRSLAACSDSTSI